MSLLLFLCLFSADSLHLERDGSLGDEDLILGAGVTLAADDAGVVYLLDPDAFLVRVFDRDLKPIRTFGTKGKGPGEFEEPKTISLTPDNEPAVFDPTLRRLTVFSPKGEVKRMVRLDVNSVAIYHPTILAGDRIAFLSARSHEGKPVYDFNLYGDEAAVVKNLERQDVPPMDWSKSSDPAFWVSFLENEMNLLGKGLPVSGGLNADTFVYARSNRYQLMFVGADGAVKKTVTRNIKPRPFTEASKMAAYEAVWNRLTVDPFLFNNMPRRIFEKAATRATPPETLPVVKAITRLGDGFVVLAQYDDHKKQGHFDLFSKGGGHLGAFPYKGPANFVTGNKTHLFTVGPNPEGDVEVIRWRLR